MCIRDSVSGHKRVRFPSVPGTNLVGSVFTDTAGTVVSSIVVPTLSHKFEAGMYLIADVPAGATALHFSCLLYTSSWRNLTREARKYRA